MKIIDIELNSKSINEAIKQLKKVQSQNSKMVSDYLQRCCKWIRKRADLYLQSSGIGADVIADIQNSAKITKKGNVVTLSYGEKAAYIEFGVGQIGQGTYRYDINPNLQGEWIYDKESGKKLSDRSWIFAESEDENIDIKPENIINRTTHTVRTQGNQATMFVYQAAMDFKSTGEYKRLWEEVKKEYIK